ncbi:2-oxoglutarate and iron-dependent oxygenase domain-containing protein CP2 isoform X1 [Brassica napus]|uniref:2-oxoglutarate and iron-dependent oxygenase domain-containing protein CP2 isoform X1 n=1 Tax=Brassica napus TaxID=3708 RepID=UPI0006AA9D75|nr:2-oxoglutarate and iron-dependent oxygenase domain-containing protein CP2 isoform X1 [Brassica napus]
MSSDQQETTTTTTTVDGSGTTTMRATTAATTTTTTFSSQRLRINPNNEHRPESYEDLKLDFPSAVYSSLEKYLPQQILVSTRDDKVKFMTDIMLRHLPHGERSRAQRHSVYRQKIITNYQPLHKELYTLAPMQCFVPSFIKAINESSEKSFRSIISEPSPGVFVFDMLQPSFCEMMLAEVENFEKWVGETKFRIMRPNTMNKYGAVLDDFGLDSMLDKLMESFIRPMTKVFFSDVGGATLDSHHGFVVEYGKDRDLDLGFHVDDSEVTLNVCLGNQFVGGELFFRGTRCERHVNTTTKPDQEIYDYSHVPGQAVLHRGRHRHGARATTSGHRVNMLLWCRSSVFRELKSHQKEFSSWCGECFCEKKEEKGRALDALRKKLVKAVSAPQA